MYSKKISVLIQARIGSKRFPAKVLEKIGKKPLLWYVINRVKQVKGVEQIILTTTRKKEDRVLEKIARKSSILFFAGCTNDVLNRFYQCSKIFHADPIIRITGDCPLIDSKLIENCLNFYKKHNYDYVTNTLEPTFPDGLDVEIFSFNSLKKAAKYTKSKSEREHVTPYIRNNKKFKRYNFVHKKNYSKFRWSVDEKKDLKFVKKVYSFMKPKTVFYMNDIIVLISKNPRLLEINSGILRNQGHLDYLKHDKKVKSKF